MYPHQMASVESFFESQVPAEVIIAGVTKIHASISKLESLRPSKIVNSLFTQLVRLCTLPISVPIDINSLPHEVRLMRESLISLCGRAEGLLELEYSIFFSKIPSPLHHLTLFPYHANYVKLARLEYNILCQSGMAPHPKSVAFVGSGPMPLTSILLATRHMMTTEFVNLDIDEVANRMARELVATDPELERRMKFTTCDVMNVGEQYLGSFDCIFLAALVGMKKEEKVKIIGHIRKHMRSGGLLLVRSANGGRAFLYPVVEEDDLNGFEIVSVFHPNDDVVNSVIVVRKPESYVHA